VKILVADDDRVSRRLLESTVARLKRGHDIVVAEDGPSALAALLEPDGPRLAILDWMMPGTDGIEVCRQVRARAERYVYVILLTARDRREDMVAAFDAEIDDFLTKPLDVVELRARLRSGERVLELQERLLNAQTELRYAATHDRLTGLWNRAMITDHLDLAMERARREHSPVAVAVVDVDRFKNVNDRYGHGVGDGLLRTVASRMQAVLRPYDGIGRYGGEEFLVVLQGASEVETHEIAERLRAAVAAEPVVAGTLRVDVSISAGVAWADVAPADPHTLVLAADGALYRAKASGRNCVRYAPVAPGLPQETGILPG
jgi:two-component system cell cycle response regulator